MDFVHAILIGSAVIQLLGLSFIAWCSVTVAHTAATVDENAKKIAEMANRNERMTMEILKKVYDVQRPQA